MLEVVCLRGLPGSGKTTLANEIIRETGGKYVHYEADQWMIDPASGLYRFDYKRLPECHQKCQEATHKALSEARKSVIVSNTFVMQWELANYVDIARRNSASFRVIALRGNFGSVHEVPQSVVDSMASRWQSWSGETVIGAEGVAV